MAESLTKEGSETPPSRAGLARNAFHLVLGQAATTAMAVFLSAALGRGLGPAEFGLYFLLTTMAAFAFVLVEWGQSTSVVRDVARSPEKAATYLGTILGLRIVGTAAAAGVTALTSRLLGHPGRTSALAALLVVAMLPFFLTQAYCTIFRGRERMDYEAITSVLNKALTFVLTLAALGAGLGLVGVILAQGVAGLGALGATVFLARRLDISPVRGTLDSVREVLAHGTPIVAIAIASSAQGYIDAIVLSKLTPEPVVGWFGAAKNIVGTLFAPAAILGTAAFPRLAKAAHDPPQFRLELHSAMRPLLGLAALAGVGTYLFADVAVNIVFGKKGFGPAGTTLKALSPGLALLFVDVMVATAIVALGRARQVALAKAFNVAAITVLDILLIPIFQTRFGNGGIGQGVAFAGGEVIMLASALWIIPSGVIDTSFFWDMGRALAAAVATLVVFRLLPSWPVFVTLPGCVIVFAAFAGAVGLVRRAEIETFRGLLLRRRRG